MPLNFSAAHSSRITKTPPRRKPLLKRFQSSPLNSKVSREPIRRTHSGPERCDSGDGETPDENLDDVGVIAFLAPSVTCDGAISIIKHVQSSMFDKLPEAGGFNSVRIAEVLNFQQSLPPLVTVAHLHAMTPSPTRFEREVCELVKVGLLRRFTIPRRGMGGANIGDGLCLTLDFENLLRCTDLLDKSLSDKFIMMLQTHPVRSTVPNALFSQDEIWHLMRAGFVTSSTASGAIENGSSHFGTLSAAHSTSISTISKAASGSMAAVGGEGAVYGAGGRGGIRHIDAGSENQSDGQKLLCQGDEYLISMPATGPYLKLLAAARSHLIALVNKSKSRQIPVYLLREKWNGGVAGDDSAARAKKYRGEFVGVAPARTRHWKHFFGLNFDWVLGECFGAGLIEMFDTRSVGPAVRLV